MVEKGVVLVSGGLDSATCLWWARNEGWDIFSLTFNYYQRSRREILAARNLADKAGVKEHRVISVKFLKENGRNPDGRPSAYVPCRNTIFYAIAASWAEVIGAQRIIGGHNAEDALIFPDARPQYFTLLNETLKLGTWSGKTSPIHVINPLEKLSKSEVVSLAVELGVPLADTWSCYESRSKACGKCHGCMVRIQAFEKAGIEDLIEYE